MEMAESFNEAKLNFIMDHVHLRTQKSNLNFSHNSSLELLIIRSIISNQDEINLVQEKETYWLICIASTFFAIYNSC